MYVGLQKYISVSFQYIKIVLSKNIRNLICVRNCCSGQLTADVQAAIKHYSFFFIILFSKALKGVGVFVCECLDGFGPVVYKQATVTSPVYF